MPSRRDVPEPEEWTDEDEELEQAIPEADPSATVPEADALEQAQDAAPGEQRHDVPTEPEVPEADAIDQAIEVPDDPEEDRHTT